MCVHPDDKERLIERETQLAAAADGTVIETAYRLKHANGEWRWLLTRETIFARMPDGTPAQVAGRGPGYDRTSTLGGSPPGTG